MKVQGLGKRSQILELVITHRLHSSSFWGLPYRILTMNPKKELLWSRSQGILGVVEGPRFHEMDRGLRCRL